MPICSGETNATMPIVAATAMATANALALLRFGRASRVATRFWPEGKYCLGYTSEQRGEWPEYFSATFEEDTEDADTLFAIISGEYALGTCICPRTPLVLGLLRSIRFVCWLQRGPLEPLAPEVRV